MPVKLVCCLKARLISSSATAKTNIVHVHAHRHSHTNRVCFSEGCVCVCSRTMHNMQTRLRKHGVMCFVRFVQTQDCFYLWSQNDSMPPESRCSPLSEHSCSVPCAVAPPTWQSTICSKFLFVVYRSDTKLGAAKLTELFSSSRALLFSQKLEDLRTGACACISIVLGRAFRLHSAS